MSKVICLMKKRVMHIFHLIFGLDIACPISFVLCMIYISFFFNLPSCFCIEIFFLEIFLIPVAYDICIAHSLLEVISRQFLEWNAAPNYRYCTCPFGLISHPMQVFKLIISPYMQISCLWRWFNCACWLNYSMDKCWAYSNIITLLLDFDNPAYSQHVTVFTVFEFTTAINIDIG